MTEKALELTNKFNEAMTVSELDEIDYDILLALTKKIDDGGITTQEAINLIYLISKKREIYRQNGRL
jgi:hypothetical protein